MPRYFFHRTDGFVDHDKEGTELENVRAARRQAIIFAGECLRDRPEQVCNGHEFRVEVTNEVGRLLFTVVTLVINASATPDLDPALE